MNARNSGAPARQSTLNLQAALEIASKKAGPTGTNGRTSTSSTDPQGGSTAAAGMPDSAGNIADYQEYRDAVRENLMNFPIDDFVSHPTGETTTAEHTGSTDVHNAKGRRW